MKHLTLALIREGSTDERFLSRLIPRLVQNIFNQYNVETTDLIEIQDLSESDKEGASDKVDSSRKIKKQTERAISGKSSFHILFVHTDGDGDPVGARRTRVDPIAQGVREALGKDKHKVVGVVPEKEMEAWALVDGDALRIAFSCNLTDEQMNVPQKPKMIETIKGLKKILQKCYQDSRGGRRARRRQGNYATFLDRIGEEVSFDILRRVPAFQQFENDLCQALEALHYIDFSKRSTSS